MKKTIVALTVALAFVVAGAAQAKVTIWGNLGDDFGIFAKAYTKMEMKIEVETENNVVDQIYTSADTGNNVIAAGDDVVSSSIESDDATNETTIQEEIGSVIIDTAGCPCQDGGEADVDVSENSSDDGVIAAEDSKELEDEIEAESENNVVRNIAAVSTAGNSTVAAGEDVEDSHVTTGKATTKAGFQFLTGSFLITRN